MSLRSVFFVASLAAAVADSNSPKCGVNGNADGKVVELSDGQYDRCISVITPSKAARPMPVLFWFHGAGGNAAHCGSEELASLAEEGGFALLCGEALQDIFGNGGQWNIPEVITDATGTPCKDSDSLDVVYINNAIAHLAASPSVYDTSRVFTSGCSMGSAFSGYISQCLKQAQPGHISAFATHSTGVKVKGDGTRLPADNYNKQYTWGECPDCQYFPFKPVAYSDNLGLKACVFDNTGDNDFYKTSEYLAKVWEQLGNKVNSTFLSGGHCQIHSFAAIVNCLDDSTKRLLPGGPLPDTPTPSPGPSPGPAPGPTPGPSPDVPSEACQECFKQGCPSLEQTGSDDCRQCVQQHQGPCTSACVPFPFEKAMSWYCDSPSMLV